MPAIARERLDELLAAAGLSSSFFSAREARVAEALRIAPVGQVVGESATRLSYGVVRATGPGAGGRRVPGEPRWLEQTGLVASWSGARRRAAARLQAQAKILSADAVVGVVVSRTRKAWADTAVAHVRMLGTAVRLPGASECSPDSAVPVVALSLQDMLKLNAAGASPVALVGGCAAVAALPGRDTRRLLRWQARSRPAAELTDFTFAFQQARRLAVGRLGDEARSAGAKGVVGITLDDVQATRAGGGDYEVVVHVVGTAIAPAPARQGAPSVVSGLR
ncbi:MAG TPA: heavy metal-binding domain-containing protein [Solirubrobacteraceae bacterium]|nr:heavy metal-binding domain-containing protein [Solirubrobacteraceae bacterium]